MNILLDTHVLWWFLRGNEKIPTTTRDTIFDSQNIIYISIASIWEVAIKMSIGKLSFDGGIDGFINAIEDENFELLGISTEHTKTVANLPFIHRDPFDRMLVAQAITENIPIMTTDANVLKYGMNSIW